MTREFHNFPHGQLVSVVMFAPWHSCVRNMTTATEKPDRLCNKLCGPVFSRLRKELVSSCVQIRIRWRNLLPQQSTDKNRQLRPKLSGQFHSASSRGSLFHKRQISICRFTPALMRAPVAAGYAATMALRRKLSTSCCLRSCSGSIRNPKQVGGQRGRGAQASAHRKAACRYSPVVRHSGSRLSTCALIQQRGLYA